MTNREETYDRRAELLEGQKHPGVSPQVDPLNPPEWFEPDTFAHAMHVYQRYQMAIGITSMYGFTLALAFGPSIVYPLLATGHSRTLPDLYDRYVSTITHTRKWYSADPFDSTSASFRSLKAVRAMHRTVAQRLNHEAPQQGGVLWMSQYSMALSQLSFVVFWALFPEKFGFHNLTGKDKHALFHFWRTMGHCLGIEDRFNICTGSDTQIERLCRDMWYEDWLPRLQKQELPPMVQGVYIALAQAIPRLHYRTMMYYAAPRIGLDPKPYTLTSIPQYISYFFFWFTIQVLTRIQWLHRLLAHSADRNLSRARQEATQRKQQLSLLYPNVTYHDDQCPFQPPNV